MQTCVGLMYCDEYMYPTEAHAKRVHIEWVCVSEPRIRDCGQELSPGRPNRIRAMQPLRALNLVLLEQDKRSNLDANTRR